MQGCCRFLASDLMKSKITSRLPLSLDPATMFAPKSQRRRGAGAVGEGHGRSARPLSRQSSSSRIPELEWKRLCSLSGPKAPPTLGWISRRRGDAGGDRSRFHLPGDARVIKSAGRGRQLRDDVFSLPLLHLPPAFVFVLSRITVNLRRHAVAADGRKMGAPALLPGKGHRL